MPYLRFLLHTRAAAWKQLLAIEAIGLGQGGDSTLRLNRLAELERLSDGR